MRTKVLLTAVCCLSFFCFPTHPVCAADVTVGKWRIDINENNAKVSVYHNNTLVVNESSCAFKNGDKEYFQDQLSGYAIQTAEVADPFGTGKKVTVTANTTDGITVTQDYYLYNDYILTEFSIASDQELASNYMAPVRSTTEVSFLPANKNRACLFLLTTMVLYVSAPITSTPKRQLSLLRAMKWAHSTMTTRGRD